MGHIAHLSHLRQYLTPYMAGKVMCLLVDQKHTVNAFSQNFLCSLPLSEYIICQAQTDNFLKRISFKLILLSY
jgi:hypothetical protein